MHDQNDDFRGTGGMGVGSRSAAEEADHFASDDAGLGHLGALAALDYLAAAVQHAIATLRWNAGNPEATSAAMSAIDLRMSDARAFLPAETSAVEETGGSAPKSERSPEETAAAGAPEAPVATGFPYPAESYLVGATRSMEAVKSLADQALLGFVLAPQEHGIFVETFGTLKDRIATAERDYAHYALASEARAR